MGLPGLLQALGHIEVWSSSTIQLIPDNRGDAGNPRKSAHQTWTVCSSEGMTRSHPNCHPLTPMEFSMFPARISSEGADICICSLASPVSSPAPSRCFMKVSKAVVLAQPLISKLSLDREAHATACRDAPPTLPNSHSHSLHLKLFSVNTWLYPSPPGQAPRSALLLPHPSAQLSACNWCSITTQSSRKHTGIHLSCEGEVRLRGSGE